MALKYMAGFEYTGKEPNFKRDLFETLEAMKNFSDNYLPEMFIASCIETGKLYLYNKSNEIDAATGKWREVGSGGAGSLTADLIATYNVGGVSEKDTLIKDTSIEEVIKKILVGSSTTTSSSYYGVANTKVTTTESLTEVPAVPSFTISVTADNQYVVIACPVDAGEVRIMSNGFDYTNSFTKTNEGTHDFYYSEVKVTCTDFEYTISFE